LGFRRKPSHTRPIAAKGVIGKCAAKGRTGGLIYGCKTEHTFTLVACRSQHASAHIKARPMLPEETDEAAMTGQVADDRLS
jgi:hypothetical protein